MPIFHVEMTTQPPPSLARTLADRLGTLMGSEPGHTWVRLVPTPAAHWAENDVSSPPSSIFVRVILRTLPDEDTLAERARAITRIVAAATARSEEEVHVCFDPPAAGRIAFGGELVRSER